MKKQNLLVLGIAVALIAAVAIFAAVAPQTRTISENAPSVIATEIPSATEAPAATEAPDEEEASETAEPAQTDAPPVNAYLVVSVRGALYEPLPLAGEGSFVIKQDENTTNTVHVTPDSVWMEHSTCDNQDCVDQGTVSLDNMESRVLSNMIICLPNEVILELVPPEAAGEN